MLNELKYDERNKETQFKALDALLLANNVSLFRLALIRNKEVFAVKNEPDFYRDVKDDDQFLEPDGVPNKKQPPVYGYKLEHLQRIAAGRRLYFGLQSATLDKLHQIAATETAEEITVILKADPHLYGSKVGLYIDGDVQDDLFQLIYQASLDLLGKRQEALIELFYEEHDDYTDEQKPLVFDAACTLQQNEERFRLIKMYYDQINKAYINVCAAIRDPDDERLADILANKQAVEEAKITANWSYNNQFMGEKIVEVNRSLDRIDANPGADKEEKKKELVKAETVLKRLQSALEEQENLVVTRGNIAFELAEIAAKKREIKAIEEEVILHSITFYPVSASLPKGNLYHKGNDFSYEIIKKEAIVPAAPAAPAALVVGPANNSTYKIAKVAPDEAIYSSFTFPRAGARPPVVARLYQDSTGKVTNKSDPTLTPQEKLKVAFQQAEMLLSNYKPEMGDITITGSAKYLDEAKCLLVALVKLKAENYPGLVKVKIVSMVDGCVAPTGGSGYINGAFNMLAGGQLSECIRNNKVQGLNFAVELKTKAPQSLERLGDLSKMNAARENDFKQKYKQLQDPAMPHQEKQRIARDLQKNHLQDGDEIDSKTRLVIKKPGS